MYQKEDYKQVPLMKNQQYNYQNYQYEKSLETDLHNSHQSPSNTDQEQENHLNQNNSQNQKKVVVYSSQPDQLQKLKSTNQDNINDQKPIQTQPISNCQFVDTQSQNINSQLGVNQLNQLESIKQPVQVYKQHYQRQQITQRLQEKRQKCGPYMIMYTMNVIKQLSCAIIVSTLFLQSNEVNWQMHKYIYTGLQVLFAIFNIVYYFFKETPHSYCIQVLIELLNFTVSVTLLFVDFVLIYNTSIQLSKTDNVWINILLCIGLIVISWQILFQFQILGLGIVSIGSRSIALYTKNQNQQLQKLKDSNMDDVQRLKQQKEQQKEQQKMADLLNDIENII